MCTWESNLSTCGILLTWLRPTDTGFGPQALNQGLAKLDQYQLQITRIDSKGSADLLEQNLPASATSYTLRYWIEGVTRMHIRRGDRFIITLRAHNNVTAQLSPDLKSADRIPKATVDFRAFGPPSIPVMMRADVDAANNTLAVVMRLPQDTGYGPLSMPNSISVLSHAMNLHYVKVLVAEDPAAVAGCENNRLVDISILNESRLVLLSDCQKVDVSSEVKNYQNDSNAGFIATVKFRISGLVRGKSYRFKALAGNSAGESPMATNWSSSRMAQSAGLPALAMDARYSVELQDGEVRRPYQYRDRHLDLAWRASESLNYEQDFVYEIRKQSLDQYPFSGALAETAWTTARKNSSGEDKLPMDNRNVQHLRTHGALDFEHFEIGGTHFLAVANSQSPRSKAEAGLSNPKSYAVETSMIFEYNKTTGRFGGSCAMNQYCSLWYFDNDEHRGGQLIQFQMHQQPSSQEVPTPDKAGSRFTRC
jgi:hypothetical protein